MTTWSGPESPRPGGVGEGAFVPAPNTYLLLLLTAARTGSGDRKTGPRTRRVGLLLLLLRERVAASYSPSSLSPNSRRSSRS